MMYNNMPKGYERAKGYAHTKDKDDSFSKDGHGCFTKIFFINEHTGVLLTHTEITYMCVHLWNTSTPGEFISRMKELGKTEKGKEELKSWAQKAHEGAQLSGDEAKFMRNLVPDWKEEKEYQERLRRMGLDEFKSYVKKAKEEYAKWLDDQKKKALERLRRKAQGSMTDDVMVEEAQSPYQ